MNAQTPTPPNAFNVADAAAYLGVGETLFRQLLRAGTISHRRAGRRIIIARGALDRYLLDAAETK